MDTSGGETHLKLTLVKYTINKQAAEKAIALTYLLSKKYVCSNSLCTTAVHKYN